MVEKLTRLPNGISVITEQRPGTGMVAMRVDIRAGSFHDDPVAPGVTFLTQEALQTGTTTKTRAQIAEFLAAKGTSIESATAHGSTYFSSVTLTADAGDVFTLLADMLKNPTFDAKEVAREKALITRALQQKDANPAAAVGEKFMGEAFKGQGITKSPMGTQASVAAITDAQIRDCHKALLSRPEDIVVSFCGDIDPAQAEALVTAQFGGLVSTGPARAKMPSCFVGGDYRLANNNEQLAILFGFEAPGLADARRYDFMMLQELIGGGMSSPLFQEIREKRGLVYGVRAGYTPLNGSGLFQIQATTGKGKVGQLIPAAVDLLGDVAQNGFTQAQLDVAVSRIARQLEASRETARGVAARNGVNVLTHGRTVPDQFIIENLKRVTPDDVRRAAASMLEGGRYAIAAVGPQDTMPAEADISAMMKAQVAGLQLPAPAPRAPLAAAAFNAVAGQQISKGPAEAELTVLPNGLRIVSVNRPGPLSAGAWVGVGADFETKAENGITHMNEHMMFKGTKSYAPGTIDKIVEKELAGGLNAYTSNDRTAYYFYNLAADGLEKTVDICGEMIFEASLSEEEFTGKLVGNTQKPGERDVVLEEIKQYHDKPGSRQWYKVNEMAYPDQPAGRTILGTAESLLAMDSQDLRDYRNIYYRSNNVVFAAVGPVDHKAFVKMVEDRYGHLQPGTIRPIETPVYKGGTTHFESDKVARSMVTLGAQGVPSAHPDAYAYMLMSMITGQGETSRLTQRLIVEKGMAVRPSASHYETAHRGMFMIGGEVETAQLKEFIAEAYGALRGVGKSVSKAELDFAKARIKMAVVMQHEQNQSVCNGEATNLLTQGKLEKMAEVMQQIDAVSVADIKRVAKAVLKSNPSVAMVVPEGTDPALIPGHAGILALRDSTGPKKQAAPTAPAP